MLEFRGVQDRYVGDIGDFGKYALLNALTQDGLRLGVHWYLNAHPESNNDGSLRRFQHLRNCDPHIFDSLQSIQATSRSVAAIERAGILPGNTVYYPQPLPSSRVPKYTNLREEWHDAAMEVLAGVNIVFLDPDNGLNLAERPKTNLNKHVQKHELLHYLKRGQSLIVYHHQTRAAGGLKATIPQTLRQLRDLGFEDGWALSFHRQSVRIYFIIPAPTHRGRLRTLTDAFLNTEWGRGKHFMMHKLSSDSLLSDCDAIKRGVRLFHHLVNQANSGNAVGIGYADFFAYIHAAKTFHDLTGRNYKPSDTTNVLGIALGITSETGRLVVARSGHSIQTGLDTFIWSVEKPHDRPIGAWESKTALPYTREQWLAVFPQGERRLITPAELESLTSR
jgi:hypothetical protein